MGKRDLLAVILAAIGTLLLWLPILSPVLFSAIAWTADEVFRFDYLMPGELFPIAFIGGALLVGAALRSGMRKKWIFWAVTVMVALLVLSQLPFVILQSVIGAAQPGPEQMPYVYLGMVLFAVYIAALIFNAVGGVLLLRDLIKPAAAPAA